MLQLSQLTENEHDKKVSHVCIGADWAKTGRSFTRHRQGLIKEAYRQKFHHGPACCWKILGAGNAQGKFLCLVEGRNWGQ